MLVLGSPFWLLRMLTAGKYRAGLASRLGFVPHALRDAARGRRVIWVHAVSVGEIIAAGRLIAELESALPGYRVCISTTTLTGHTLARQRFGSERVFYFPLDFAFIVRRYLHALSPELVILVETEFWPNLLLQCARRHVPVAVVNARISDRSLPRYRRLRALWRPLLAKIALFCAQSEEDATRLRAIGAPAERVRVLGNLKFDVRSAADEGALVAVLRAQLHVNAKVLVCGSTMDTEEAALLDCLPALTAAVPGLVCILAPRHPERFSAVAQLLEQRGVAFTRRLQWTGQLTDQPLAGVFLLDTVGELASVYALADLAFVGGSLIAAGGHNPLEPAQFGVPVVMGESYENFRGIVSAMRDAGGIEIVSRTTLCAMLTALLTDTQRAAALGEAAQRVFLAESGATERTVAALMPLLRRSA
ncbi:MAG TPA: 3-deoxy-D-manno-octulosonic acid transferase [Acidobacteriaceae bacterium]|nr:3-deoxy-D-manno-octulosonic acid transferase [Acidobacteriaceae bacterium]